MSETVLVDGVDAALKFAKEHLHPAEFMVLHVTDPVTGITAPVIQDMKGGLQGVKSFTDPYRQFPERRKGRAQFYDVASFVEHTKRFLDTDSIVYAFQGDGKTVAHLLSVLDYNKAGPYGAQPRYGEHRGLYCFPLSKQWKAWTAASGVSMNQGAFALFIEEHIVDVSLPPADQHLINLASLLDASFAMPKQLFELARGLSVNENAKVTQRVNPNTGEKTVSFKTEQSDDEGNPIRVPSLFLITIPVLDGEKTAYRIPVRLRFRKVGEALQWTVELYKAEDAFEDAFNGICERVAKETGLAVLRGTPEA